MKSITRYVFCVLALAVAAGCASTKVIGREEYRGEKIPRPAHILVYDFAATTAEVPADSALAGKYEEHPTPQTLNRSRLAANWAIPLRRSWSRRSATWDCRPSEPRTSQCRRSTTW